MSLLRTPCLATLALLVALLAAPSGARGQDDGLVSRTYPLDALVGGTPPVRVPMLGIGLRGPWSLETVLEVDGEEDEPLEVRTYEEEEVLDLLRALVGGLGEDEGEVLEVGGGRLLVTTTPERQVRVQDLLGRMWHEASRRVHVSVERLRLDAAGVGRLPEGVLPALRAGHVPVDDLEVLLAHVAQAGGRHESAAARVQPGARAVLGRIERVRYLRDYEVEIAQDSTVGDPMVDTLTLGWALEVRPFVLQGGDVLLEAFVQSAQADLPIRRLSLETPPFGAIELPRTRVLRTTTRSRIRSDAARAIVVDEGPEGVEAFLVASRVLPARGEEALLRLDASALVTPYGERTLLEHWDSPGFWVREPRPVDDVEPAFDDERLLEHLLARSEPGAWEAEGAWLGLQEGGRLVALGNEAARGLLARVLDGLERAAFFEGLRVRLAVSSVGVDGTRRSRGRVALDVPPGRLALWQSGVEAAYLADWAVEVAQEARMGDPDVQTLFAGTEVEVRAVPAPAGGVVAVRLAARIGEASTPFDLVRPGNECTGPIEVPRTTGVGTQADLVVEPPRGEELLLGLTEDGQRIVLEVFVDA